MLSPTSLTIDIGDPGAVADKAIGRFEDVIQTDTEAYLLNHLRQNSALTPIRSSWISS